MQFTNKKTSSATQPERVLSPLLPFAPFDDIGSDIPGGEI